MIQPKKNADEMYPLVEKYLQSDKTQKLNQVRQQAQRRSSSNFWKTRKQTECDKFQKGVAFFAMVENQGAGKLKLRAKSLQFSLAKERELFDIPNPKGHPFVMDAGKEDMKATASRPRARV